MSLFVIIIISQSKKKFISQLAHKTIQFVGVKKKKKKNGEKTSLVEKTTPTELPASV